MARAAADLWPGLPLTSSRGNTFPSSGACRGDFHAEALASDDRVLSVLPHDLVAEGWVQVPPWLFLETLLLFLYFVKSGSSVVLLSEGDFGCECWNLSWWFWMLCRFPDESERGEGVMYTRISAFSFAQPGPLWLLCWHWWPLGGVSHVVFILLAYLF